MTLVALALGGLLTVRTAAGPQEPSQPPGALASQAPGVVESVAVHGNHTTPTGDVLSLAGDVVGQPATDVVIREITERLERSGRFAGVDVRRRFLSIDDPSRVLLVIVVDEHPAVSADDLTPGPMKRFMAGGMWLPVLEYQEGYGFTYGARIGVVNALGPRSRISAPLTWGGRRQAEVEIERTFASAAIARVVGGGGISRRENPYFELGDTRQSIWGRVESAPRSWLRAGVKASTAAVSFGPIDDRLTIVGADLALDTRRDPALPRNAVFVSTGIERLGFGTQSVLGPAAEPADLSARRVSLDARGYVGLFRQVVLAARAQSITASDTLPPYELALLGGMPSLRGYDVGSNAGDNLAALSAELLMPLTSPLSVGRFGIKAFADYAAVYAAGTAMRDQAFRWGYGAGVFVHATVLTIGVDVGWREHRSTPNAHVLFGLQLR